MNRIALIVSLLVVCALFALNAVAQDSKEVTKTVSLKADGEITVDTYKGTIVVSTWDKPQVEIHAKIEADDEFGSKYSEEKVRDTEIQIEATESKVRIKTNYENIRNHNHGFWSWFGEDSGSLPLVHYTITMPKTANLRIKDYKSETSVAGLRSDVDLDTYKGRVEITDLDGSLQLQTYKGDAEVRFIRLSKRSRCETYKGKITITLQRNAGFELDANLGHRTDFDSDFQVDLQSSGRRHRDTEFRGPVNGGGPELVLRSTKGDIRLRGR